MKTLEEFLFTCDLCGRSFRRGIGLSTHRRTRHFDRQGNIRQETLDLAKSPKPLSENVQAAMVSGAPVTIAEPEISPAERKRSNRINLMVNSVGYQLEFMFGFARGLVRTKFQKRCREYLEANGTDLPRSSMRRMMEDGNVVLDVPLHCRKRYEMALDVCDLFEAICNDIEEKSIEDIAVSLAL